MLNWPPRDLRAILALVASVLGAGVLTGFAMWVTWILWRGGWAADTGAIRIAALAKALLGLLGIIGAVLLSLGLAINRRSLKGTAFGASFEASGGDDAPAAAAAVAQAAVTKADEIKGEV